MHAKQQSANYETNIDRTKRKNIFTKIIGNFSALFTDKTSRKRSVNHGELGQYYKPTKFIKYMYRTLYPTTECTVFSIADETFIKVDHRLDKQVSINHLNFI